jgi:glycerol-3-phosphate acyltransferase PlsX
MKELSAIAGREILKHYRQEIKVEYKADMNRFEIIHTTDVITNNDHPVDAIRKKKDSSLVVGMKLLKDKKGEAFISAGNTGAVLAGGLFVAGRIKGIDRPAIAPILPGKNKPFMLIDAGANAECKPVNLLQFAVMGEIYMNKVLNVGSPEVALVNIGAEEEKGSKFTREAFGILKNSSVNFIGNIEGREIPEGAADVVVCDGFIGNTILKMFEGVTKTIFDILKEEIMSSTRSKIGGMLLKPVFKSFKKKFDYTEYGGAILLGTDGTVIKAHGSSNAKAIKNAIRQAVLSVKGGVVESIKLEIIKLNSHENNQGEDSNDI